jgi:DnaJ family protein C protein 9
VCLYFSGDFDEESDEMVERDWNEYWRRLFKPITVKDISDYEKKYKGTGKRTVLSEKETAL